MVVIESAGITDVGRKRKGNEDALFIDDNLESLEGALMLGITAVLIQLIIAQTLDLILISDYMVLVVLIFHWELCPCQY